MNFHFSNDFYNFVNNYLQILLLIKQIIKQPNKLKPFLKLTKLHMIIIMFFLFFQILQFILAYYLLQQQSGRSVEMQNSKQQSKKLQMKYLLQPIFKAEVDQRYKNYHRMLNESIYTDLSSISDDLFVCYRGDHPIYFYFGLLQNCNRENLHKFAMYFIRFFVHKPVDDFSFIFLNTKASSEAYGFFKEVFLQLTMDHFLHLKQFIILRPSYYHRAQDYMSFGFFSNYLRNLTLHFYNATELCSYLKMSQQDFVDIVPKQIAQVQFPKLKARKLSLQDQRINFQGQLMGQNQRTLRREFQAVMKSFLIVKPGQQTYKIQDYELNKFGVPVVLQMLVFYFKNHQEGLKQQGLFRKSVSIDEQNQTLNQLANKNYEFLVNIQNPHIVANLIKRFFSNLKIPIFPYAEFQILMHDQGVSDKKQQVKEVVETLPKLNFMTLLYLLQFLRQDVISNVAFNKMTAQNISICFAPCLLRAEKASTADLIYASKCAIITRILLDNFEQIFGNANQRYQMFRRSEDRQTKNADQRIQQSIKMDKIDRLSGKVESKQKRENNNPQNQQKKFQQIEDQESETRKTIVECIEYEKQQILDEDNKIEYIIRNTESHWTPTASVFGFSIPNPNTERKAFSTQATTATE